MELVQDKDKKEAKSSLVQTEEKILEYWQKERIFEKSLEIRKGSPEYVFYDGPPFATGTPHYGHIVAGTMKDIVPRYWTMKGNLVNRKWGWDTHGLPIENLVEKEMRLKSRKDIEALGVNKFNEACRSKVLEYADYWKVAVKRLGRFVDMENDYKTMDKNFMETIWWVFKSLYDKGLIYEDYKSMHICPHCETTLSNLEVVQGYKGVKDISATLKFELVDEHGTYVLAWTTTPWTLPGNVSLAVGADIDYVKVKDGFSYYIVAKVLKDKVVGESLKVVEEFKGEKLVNKKYKPLFDFYLSADLKNKENLYKIVSAEFVSTEDGTGVVHIAPAFGEDDMNLGREKKLSFIQHVSMDGKFKEEVALWSGFDVKPKGDPTKTDRLIVEYLQKKGLLFKTDDFTHSYPHCWRCDSPLLNYATHSWFVNVTKLKPRMLELAKKINWVPEHLKEGRFGKWLEGAKDWSISRSRYWGSVIPVWKCDACKEQKVLGSAGELEKLIGAKVDDLHKHFIDKLTFKCAKCGGIMKRVPEVLDCWFESGSMPYAQIHYPFENTERFEKTFPAEFIAEGVDQTRAWFYVLHVLSTALFDDISYKNVIANGIVLASDGQKMSKSKKNYPDPMEVVNKYGADALRYYLTASPVMKAEDLRFVEKDVDEVYKKVMLILQNVLSFYEMFKEGSQTAKKSNNVLDRWILAKLQVLIEDVTRGLDAYDLPKAIAPIGDFVTELSTWYIRRSRERFKSDGNAEAVATLKEVLEKLALVMAPFTPFIAENIWQRVKNDGSSVHLQFWPKAEDTLMDNELLDEMDKARKVVEISHSLRAESKIKVRQPLASVTVGGGVKLKQELLDIIADEVNVKKVVLGEVKNEKGLAVKELSDITIALDTRINEELEAEGWMRDFVRAVNDNRKKMGLTLKDLILVEFKSENSKINQVIEANKKVLGKQTLSSEIKFNESLKDGKIIEIGEVTCEINLMKI